MNLKEDCGCSLGLLITENNEYSTTDNNSTNFEIPTYATFDLLVLEALQDLRNQDIEEGLFVYCSQLVADWIEKHYLQWIDGDILSQTITALHQAAFAGMVRLVNFCNKEYFLHVGPNVFDMEIVREETKNNEVKKKRTRYSNKSESTPSKKDSLPSRLNLCFCHLNETDRARAHVLGCVSNRPCAKCKNWDLTNNCPSFLKMIKNQNNECECNKRILSSNEDALFCEETLSDLDQSTTTTTTTTELSYEGTTTKHRYTTEDHTRNSKRRLCNQEAHNYREYGTSKNRRSRDCLPSSSTLSRLSRRIKQENPNCDK